MCLRAKMSQRLFGSGDSGGFDDCGDSDGSVAEYFPL